MARRKYLSTGNLSAREIKRNLKRGIGEVVKTKTGQLRYLNQNELFARNADNLRRRIDREIKKATGSSAEYLKKMKSQIREARLNGDETGLNEIRDRFTRYQNLRSMVQKSRSRVRKRGSLKASAGSDLFDISDVDYGYTDEVMQSYWESVLVDFRDPETWKRRDEIGKKLMENARDIYAYTYNVVWTEGDQNNIYELLKQHVEEETGQRALNHLDVYEYYHDAMSRQYFENDLFGYEINDAGEVVYFTNFTSGYAQYLAGDWMYGR